MKQGQSANPETLSNKKKIKENLTFYNCLKKIVQESNGQMASNASPKSQLLGNQLSPSRALEQLYQNNQAIKNNIHFFKGKARLAQSMEQPAREAAGLNSKPEGAERTPAEQAPTRKTR